MTQPSVVIGHDTQTGEEVLLPSDARARSTYIIGITGTGKSTLLETMAYQDMVNGDGLCFVDPHEDAAERLLHSVPAHRAQDVIFWDPSDRARPFGLNPFWCPDPEEIDNTAENFVAALGSLEDFRSVFAAGAPRMKNLLHRLAITFVANPGHALTETTDLLTNPGFRATFYPGLVRHECAHVWRSWQEFDEYSPGRQREEVASSLNKLERLQTHRLLRGIFGQPENAIDFRAAMDDSKIIIVKLSGHRLGEDTAAFIGAFIVWGILQAALSRSDAPRDQRPQFHLFADEFQRFMSAAFPRIIAETRKYGLDTAVAHQHRSQLSRSNRDAILPVNNKIIFTVTGADAQELSRDLSASFTAPVLEPLAFLERHPHRDGEAHAAHQEVLGHINEVVAGVENLTERRVDPDHRSRLRAVTDDFLHDAMVADDVPAPATLTAAMATAFDRLYGSSEEFVLAVEIQEQRPAWTLETEQAWDEHFARVLAFWEEEERLKAELALRYGRSAVGDPSAAIWPLRVPKRSWRRLLPGSRSTDGDGEYETRRVAHQVWVDTYRAMLSELQPPSGITMSPYDFLWQEQTSPAAFLARERRLLDSIHILAAHLVRAPCVEAAPPPGASFSTLPHTAGSQHGALKTLLANQPQFCAFCSVGRRTGPLRVAIATLPFTAPASADRARSIREHSRTTYGLPSAVVARSLAERLAGDRQPASQEEPARDRVDDDGVSDADQLIFGEQAEAAKNKARQS